MTKEEYQSIGSVALGERLVERLRAAGRRPFLIPVGGSSGLGSWAYLEAVREIQAQQADGRPFTDIALVRSLYGGLEPSSAPGLRAAGSCGGRFKPCTLLCDSLCAVCSLLCGSHLAPLRHDIICACHRVPALGLWQRVTFALLLQALCCLHAWPGQ